MNSIIDKQLTNFMKDKKIDSRDLYNYKVNILKNSEEKIDSRDLYKFKTNVLKNAEKKMIENSEKMIKIFDLNSEDDCRLVKAYLTMINIDSEELILKKLCEKNPAMNNIQPEKEHFIQVLYELYMNPVFELLAFNWLSYIDCISKN